MAHKYVYFFSAKKSDGGAGDKKLLGGKGANLAEMSSLGIPVPPGFTISTEVCTYYYAHERKYPAELQAQIDKGIQNLEATIGKRFGDKKNPLLVSVRSGAPVSMPGMMDTILNLGLNDETVLGLIENTGNKRFSYDSYRRFIQMYGNVVMGMKHHDFEHILEQKKKVKGVDSDLGLDAEDLEKLVGEYKAEVKKVTGKDFPQAPKDQLSGAVDAVFASWMNDRAITYRKLNNISEALGTAVNIQSMVFGNMGDDCGTGVAFTRNPATGERKFFGEFLMNAQGEDVVAGIRTPLSIEKLGEKMPEALKELLAYADKLEHHYKDMQDIEFTIERSKLYMLQTRTGKRTAFAAIRTAVEMVDEKLIDEKTALKRIDAHTLPSLLAKIFDEKEKKDALAKGLVVAKGLPAGPGAASGKIVLTAEKAVEWKEANTKSILVRTETSPEDISGMHSSEGILTARGGMTSHAAVVARGMNKPCIVGCNQLEVDYAKGIVTFNLGTPEEVKLKEGDAISIDGFTGQVLNASLNTIASELEQVFVSKTMPMENSLLANQYSRVMQWADKYARLKVRTNADTPHDAQVARSYGAQGIGLCRTEHMFFHEERIAAVREMILSSTREEREKALAKLLPFQRDDFKGIFEEMQGLAVTVRLLDPPLHEFLPNDEEQIAELAKTFGKSVPYVHKKIEDLKEFNPMLGHRGCRLGITYPEITAMQTRAIIEAAAELVKNGKKVFPEIMVPLVGHYKELENQARVIRETAEAVQKEKGVKVDFLLGTMIEVPRAAVTADEIAHVAQFFSFGTNDLTQMTSGFSRDDSEHFLPYYIQKGIYPQNPFQVLDAGGVGKLIEIAIEKGRSTNPKIKLGVCGEHGGDPESIQFCHAVGLDYVSCSPYRVPIARLAAAQAAIG
ncbi:MAG: Pyruvate, phosphate dikinase [Turneriella sp.]|nr:Pyruvate, phosphate dikinase [Turneriella sp.]